MYRFTMQVKIKLIILDSERSDECIDFTMMCVFFFLNLGFLKLSITIEQNYCSSYFIFNTENYETIYTSIHDIYIVAKKIKNR
ncbi:hypothetical protein FWK35_00024141 [Aphis craccivora]|uniref:Uncharacterized protein n=1 Tax=Aphis craccivora TaxID=307492 RepID=A0A6G0YI66_APHCR|nr:hypothetical protein FWK35_00024141 [Aphis craccivora]